MFIINIWIFEICMNSILSIKLNKIKHFHILIEKARELKQFWTWMYNHVKGTLSNFLGPFNINTLFFPLFFFTSKVSVHSDRALYTRDISLSELKNELKINFKTKCNYLSLFVRLVKPGYWVSSGQGGTGCRLLRPSCYDAFVFKSSPVIRCSPCG